MVFARVLVMILLNTFLSQGSKVDVWEFRTHDLSSNQKVKAFYSKTAPQWVEDLKVYTICFRYNIHYVTKDNSGFSIIASSRDDNHQLDFLVSTENTNAISQLGIGGNQVSHLLFFKAKVSMRQWNSRCFVKSLKDQMFRVLHNGNIVYSYNECITSAEEASPPGGLETNNVPCFDGNWTFSNGQAPKKKIGPCTFVGYKTKYWWCPVTVNQTTNEYSYEHDWWGYCSLSCLDKPDEVKDILATKPLSRGLINNIQFGLDQDLDTSLLFKGMISDVNIWDYVLSDDDLRDFANCKSSSIFDQARVSWNDPGKFWTLVEEEENLKVTKMERDKLCRGQDSVHTYGFTWMRNYATSFKLCSSLNGQLLLPESMDEERQLWDQMRTSCKAKRIWIGVTDHQDEGEYMDIRKNNYREVFENYKETVGTLIQQSEIRERWDVSEPNGGVSENCVETAIDRGWHDRPCEHLSCAACTVSANQVFKLRGLCSLTKFDTEYAIVSDNGVDPYFISLNGWNITYDKNTNGFKLYNPFKSGDSSLQAHATYTETQEYPTGYKLWNVVNDNCPGNSTKYLVFSNCNATQFTCNDGSCIPLVKRCDSVTDCEDNSDEFDCTAVKIDPKLYGKDISPKPPEKSSNRLEVDVNIGNFQVIQVNDKDERINVQFVLSMSWIDERITYSNLKHYQLTQLSTIDAKKLWYPAVKFVESNTRTVFDGADQEGMQVMSDKVHLERNLNELREQYLFFGSETTIYWKRAYEEGLSCQFDLSRHPFDFQTCALTLRLLHKQKDSVQLQTKQLSWPIELPEEQKTVGEFFVENVVVKQPKNSDQTEIVVEFQVKRSFWTVVSTTYVPTIILLIIVQLTFYFPLENIQVRATVVLSCFLILSTLLIGASTTTTSGITYLQIWIIFAVLLTFLDITLQVLIGHLKQKESKDDEIHKTSKVNDISLRIGIANQNSKKYGDQAKQLNDYGGKILSPILLGVFTLSYFTFALHQYYSF